MSGIPALFTFGTLMDPDVLRQVGGQPLSALTRETATVRGFARHWVEADDYPVLVAREGEQTTGLIIRGLSSLAMQRIEFFEGEEFTLQELWVRNAARQEERVHYFADNQRKPASDRSWSLAEWQLGTKKSMMPRVERYMACFGRMSTAEADACW